MPATLSSPNITNGITATLTNIAGSSNTSTTVNNASTFSPTVGSGTGNVNKVHDSLVTIADNVTPATIDLNATTDPQGNAIVFSVVNAIKLTGVSVTAGQDITPFGGTNGLFTTGTQKVYAGTTPGSITFDFGTTGVVVDATHKILQLAVAAGTNVTCKVTVIGK